MKRFILFFILFFFSISALSDSGIMRDNTKVKKAGDTMTGDLTGTNIIVPGILTINTVDAGGSSVTLNTNCYISVGYDLRVSSAYVYELWVSTLRGFSPIVFGSDVLFKGNFYVQGTTEIGTSTVGVRDLFVAPGDLYGTQGHTGTYGRLNFVSNFTTNSLVSIARWDDKSLCLNGGLTMRIPDTGGELYYEWGQTGASNFGLHLGGICGSTGDGYLGLMSGQYGGIKLSDGILGVEGLYVQKGLGSGGLSFAAVKALTFDCVNPEGTSKSILSYGTGDWGRDGTILTTNTDAELTIRGYYSGANHTAAIFDTGAANLGAWYTLNLIPLRDNQDIGGVASLVAGCSTYRDIYFKGKLVSSGFPIHLSTPSANQGDVFQVFSTSATWGASAGAAIDYDVRESTGDIAKSTHTLATIEEIGIQYFDTMYSSVTIDTIFWDLTNASETIHYIDAPLEIKEAYLGTTIAGDCIVNVSTCETAGGNFHNISTGICIVGNTEIHDKSLTGWTTALRQGWVKFSVFTSAITKPVTVGLKCWSELWKKDVGITQFYATGGTITETGGYRIHKFTTSGTLTVVSSGTVDALVVAGGGGGGSINIGGGGGAGGLLYNESYLVDETGAFTITVGTGGTGGGGGAGVNGSNGMNSVFSTMTAIGGGGGGGGTPGEKAGVTGGSGGGGGGADSGGGGAGGSGTALQGNDGGHGYGADSQAGAGGGGGAGAVGAAATANTGGNGGVGLSYSISGTPVYYSGGGGGGGNVTAGSGGNGGGGAGTAGNPPGQPGSGTANTGGGGGGCGGFGAAITGGIGGSGVVIIRYPYP